MCKSLEVLAAAVSVQSSVPTIHARTKYSLLKVNLAWFGVLTISIQQGNPSSLGDIKQPAGHYCLHISSDTV